MSPIVVFGGVCRALGEGLGLGRSEVAHFSFEGFPGEFLLGLAFWHGQFTPKPNQAMTRVPVSM